MTTYKKMWNELIKHDKLTLLTHIDPDGDTMGSTHALKHLLLESKPTMKIKVTGERVPKNLISVNNHEEVSDEYFYSSQLVVVDTGTEARIADKRAKAIDCLNIDHHHDEDEFKLRIGGDHWPATGQVLYEMAKELNLKINKEAARGMYYAIWTDTEGLTQRNISQATIDAIKELGKDGIAEECKKSLELPDDIKDLINSLKSKWVVHGDLTYIIEDKKVIPLDYFRPIIAELSNATKTEVFCSIMLDEKNDLRGSFRSKGNIDVSILASNFGGGGHFSSSGFTCDNLEIAKKNIEILKEKF
ncbi:MAG: hypothetical protein GY679_03485 [Mycoplasma sp.]|nr:hypothetical protein [Mycoplasma sp.]